MTTYGICPYCKKNLSSASGQNEEIIFVKQRGKYGNTILLHKSCLTGTHDKDVEGENNDHGSDKV